MVGALITALSVFFAPIDAERRAGLVILTGVRWMLIAAAAFTIAYQPGTSRFAFSGIALLIALAVAMNIILHARLRSRRTIFVGLPLLAGVYDAAAITTALGLADGFTNESFVLYYPALLAFSIVFRGWWSLYYGAAVLTGYTLISVFTHGNFVQEDGPQQKVLILRLATMAATVVIGNMVVRIERSRRQAAVAAEAARARDVLELEQRARVAERAARDERRRLAQDVHDGISQNVYMLTLGLETAAAVLERERGNGHVDERLSALVRLSKQTLLDTRSLLFDLEQVMAGQTSLAALVQNQAREFTAVTGIAVEVDVIGDERPLPPAATGEVYRVVQEGLANVYKHARAGSVTLRLAYQDRGLRLAVEDDGCGFDPAHNPGRGYGVSGMRERIARLHGTLTIDAAPGRGTRLAAVIPYAEAEHGPDTRPAG
ncbi:MAG: sensor histidine kinase [Chloroflexi bacterium]|nr:sensor histidine kinase [Chloroflexota bacterium]